jgi:hypothetical protein
VVSKFPKNGEIALGEVRRTSGGAISGRTATGISNAIPSSASFLRNFGGHFTQLYDNYSDNFAVGTMGVNGQFTYVMYINSMIGYVNPAILTLMYCEPQVVSQMSEVVAILDCMDALPIRLLSKTSKYPNGNPVFDAAGNLLHDDGVKATDTMATWKSISDKTMFSGGVPYYGNGQKMYDATGFAWFSDGKVAFKPAERALKFQDGVRDFSSAGRVAYYAHNNKDLYQTTPTGAIYNYQAGETKKLAEIVKNPDGTRSAEVFYLNGVKALEGSRIYREEGSEAPVEVYGTEEHTQSAVIWSASQLYSNISITQFTKEATFNVVDEFVGNNGRLPGPPQNPVNLALYASHSNALTASWNSGGGAIAGFTYKMIAGSTAPVSCLGGVDVGLNMTANFAGLIANTTYTIRVCSRDEKGVFSSGSVVSATTNGSLAVLVSDGSDPMFLPADVDLSMTKTFTVVNQGLGPVKIIGVEANGNGFSVVTSKATGNCNFGSTINDAEACVVDVKFDSAGLKGVRDGLLTISYQRAATNAVFIYNLRGVARGVYPWQNKLNPLDVNNDGFVSPLDILAVINEVNRGGSRALDDIGPTQDPKNYVDANGDGWVSPLDALVIMNHINSGR